MPDQSTNVAHRGQRDGAGLLLLRLQVSDEVPEIATADSPELARRYRELGRS